ELLHKLPSDIEYVKPDIVVVLVGFNNVWNYWGLADFEKRSSMRLKMGQYLYASRTFTLFMILKNRLENTRLFRRKENKEYVTDKDSKEGGEMNAAHYDTLGLQYKSEGKYEKAILNFKKSIALDASNALPYLEMGRIFIEQKEYVSAMRFFDKVLTFDNFRDSALLGIGHVYIRLEDYEKALQSFRKGLSIEPQHSHFYSGIGKVYMEQGKYDEALEWFLKGLAINQKDSTSTYNIGMIYRVKDDNNKALEWFNKGISAVPDCGGNYCGIAEIYEERGDYANAFIWFEKGLKADATFRGLFLGLSRLALKTGNAAQVCAIIKKHGRDNPFAMAILLQMEGRAMQSIDTDDKIKQWVESDIERIIAVCQKNNIKIILQDYPGDYAINRVLKKTAAIYHIPFVNNSERINALTKKESFIARDGIHCNDRGYAMMAENVYEKIAGKAESKKGDRF
ncbi:MAG: tetratricopeptide repeat protein, partial [Candidatus Heimdallarchaeota archaeon]|nr:tetratricopeptide repeat protein [Candidatus Heimdallarchaeota archaeon]